MLAERLGSIPPASSTRPKGEAVREMDFRPTALDLSALVLDNTDFVFRSLRRAGLDVGTAEDGAQQVFLIAARKLDRIEAGKERAFLYATAVNVAADGYEAEFPRGVLAEEAEVLRIETLTRAGEKGEATRRANRFLAERPASPAHGTSPDDGPTVIRIGAQV